MVKYHLKIHGTKHSKGVAVLFRKSLDFEILGEKIDNNGRFIILKCCVNNEKFSLINIDAPNKVPHQVNFINDLMKVMAAENITNSDNIIIGGDWNLTLNDQMNKLGGIGDSKRKSVMKLTELFKSFDLLDVWRLNHNNLKRYTWRQKKPRIHCRLDYFLISHHVLDITIKTDVLPSIQSDHSPILIDFKYIQKPTLGAGTWKLNTSLLKDEEYKNQFRDNLTEWLASYDNLTNRNLKWEIIKYEVRKFSIKYCKHKKREEKARESELENNLKKLEEKENAKDEEVFTKIERLKSELQNIQLHKAQGSIIRSRAQWNEEGEKSTSYFFNLEKKNAIEKKYKKIKT